MRLRSFSVFLLLASADVSAGDEWETIRRRNGVEVQRREVAGSGIYEFRSSCTINTTVQRLYPILADISQCTNWVDDCLLSEVLSDPGDTQLVGRIGIKVPWPFRDRDVVFVAAFEDRPDGDLVVSFEGTPDYLRRQRGYARVKTFRSRWEVQALEGRAVQVDCYFFIDPGGWLPNWVVNWAMKQGPYNSIRNLRRLVAKRAPSRSAS